MKGLGDFGLGSSCGIYGGGFWGLFNGLLPWGLFLSGSDVAFYGVAGPCRDLKTRLWLTYTVSGILLHDGGYDAVLHGLRGTLSH